MNNNIFENIDTLIKGIIYFCLLLAATIVSLFVLYFVFMTIYRTCGLCWDLIFEHDWIPE